MSVDTIDITNNPQFTQAIANKADKDTVPALYMPRSDAESGFSNIQTQINGINKAVLPGTYTVATLPDASQNQAKYAFVTNLGGGADMVLSDGTYWKHIRRGKVQDVTAATSVIVTPLLSPTIISVTGTTVAGLTGSIKLDSVNLYPGYDFTLVVAGLLGVGTTLGLGLAAGGGVTTLLGGSWYDFQYDGTKLVKIRGSSLI